jgi:ribA/ribD-fused uncharacterized protein
MDPPQLLEEFISISKKDPNCEIECKLLSGKIQTKDVADRILDTIKTLSIGPETDENRLSFSYPDSTRVSVVGPQNIYNLISKNTFREIPVYVEKKQRYFEGSLGKKDVIDNPEYNYRITMRSEKFLRKDWEGNPNDPRSHIRIVNRKSFKTANELFRIDFSMVKTRGVNVKQSLKELLQTQHAYELEIEFVGQKSSLDPLQISGELSKIMNSILQSYWQSPFILPMSDIQRYQQEFKLSGNTFYDLVTLERKHLIAENKNSISKGYTVTNKADGERAGLYIARNRKVLKIDKQNVVVWTGLTANTEKHVGDFIDGEYIPSKNLFCIFDIYRFRNRDVKHLPLMKSDDDTLKNPLQSRLGCAREFVQDLKTEFTVEPSGAPLRIETKLFLAGDGTSMEEAIQTMLNTKFEYEIDGLIFTPKSSPVAPTEDRRGKTWLKVYKWKPASHNSIDFLIKVDQKETFDPINKRSAKKGELYVARSAGDDIVYPRETLTGEYVPKELPESLKNLGEGRIPAIFQPVAPRDPDAYQILIPTNEKGIPVDKYDQRVDDNTIVECTYDTEKREWTVMRTRYDKTYKYRVLREAQYGNDIAVANSVWTSMHIPIPESMIQTFVSNPPSDVSEDDMYYRDDLKRSSRLFNDVYNFHNRIKDDLYRHNLKENDTLLELAVGRGGDLHKWKRIKPSKVVGIDLSLSNLVSPTQGAVIRYLREKPPTPALFLQGDMTEYPLFDQEDKYMPILTGKETGPTSYLKQFEGLQKFDSISCQFALHYACETEEVFHNFAKNIEKYGKDVFFGTCLDGQAVYSLMIGKKTHIFGAQKQVVGEYTKQYDDMESWEPKFGLPISVYMESFEKPAVEYLVPFEKVVQIMEEHGFDLVESKMFSEIYLHQSQVNLSPEEQTFCFLNRTFVFRKRTKIDKEEEVSEKKAEEEEVSEKKEENSDKEEEPSGEPKEGEVSDKKDEPSGEPEKPKKRKLRTGGEEEEKPVLFSGADESKGEHRNFSNMSEHPIDMGGEQFPSVEHYYQAMKAREFENADLYNKIIKTKTAKAVKALGKKVTNFKTEVWDSKKDEIMRKAVRAKFVQHPELRKQLMQTGDQKIGFADARDTYWAIGTSTESTKSLKPSKWRGQNRLGKLLMELRQEFQENTPV